MKRFRLTEDEERGEIRDYYRAHGYVVLDALVPDRLLDPVLHHYTSTVKPSRDKFFRQNTNRYEANVLNAHGHVRQSFLDIHNYERRPAFRDAAMEVYFSDPMRRALSAITGEPTHHLMQSMLFDLNTATPPHQDCWYLDSVPTGDLLAAWIAMEDIDERAGRFFVLPGSWQTRLHDDGPSYTVWLERMRDHLAEHQAEVLSPALRKGDAIFWSSRTIHGSLPTADESFSRRSLTAHYLPSTRTFGNLFKAKDWIRYKEWRGHKYFANQPEYSLAADLLSRAKAAVYDRPLLLRLARRFQSKAIADF
jgi:phytanoyl-CoA hydroxylase